MSIPVIITWKQQIKFAQNLLYLTEWFHQQNEFKPEFERMEVNERLSIDHHLTSPPNNKKIWLGQLWTCLVKPIKDLIPTWKSLSSREIYKSPLTGEAINKIRNCGTKC